MLRLPRSTAACLPALALTCLTFASSGCQLLVKSKPGEGNRPEAKVTGPGEVFAVVGDGFEVRRPAKSWRTGQRENVVMQQYDYSCGAAALTTLFRFYFRDDIQEDAVMTKVFESIPVTAEQELHKEVRARLGLAGAPEMEWQDWLQRGLTPEMRQSLEEALQQRLEDWFDQELKRTVKAELEDRQKNGFSMLDLFRVAEKRDYRAAVVRLSLPEMMRLEAPVIVRLVKDDYKHFVVLRGFHDNTAYLADPIRGNVRMSIQEFRSQWSGEALILEKPGFGLPKDHPLALRIDGPARPELQVARQALFPLR